MNFSEKLSVLESIWGKEDARQLPKVSGDVMNALETEFGSLRIGKGKCAILIRHIQDNVYQLRYQDGSVHPARLYKIPTYVEGYKLKRDGKAIHLGSAKYKLVVGQTVIDPAQREHGLTSAMTNPARSFSTLEKRMEEQAIDPVEVRAIAKELYDIVDHLKKGRTFNRSDHSFCREVGVSMPNWMKVNVEIHPNWTKVEREGNSRFRNGILKLFPVSEGYA